MIFHCEKSGIDNCLTLVCTTNSILVKSCICDWGEKYRYKISRSLKCHETCKFSNKIRWSPFHEIISYNLLDNLRYLIRLSNTSGKLYISNIANWIWTFISFDSDFTVCAKLNFNCWWCEIYPIKVFCKLDKNDYGFIDFWIHSFVQLFLCC